MLPRFLTLLFSLIFVTSCTGQQQTNAPAEDAVYTYQTPSRNGTDKYYLGREISYVMGHQAADWLERAEREDEENVSQAIANMNIQPDESIADIGAGSGYYTFRMAAEAPEGKVYAVDLQPEMLALMQEKIEREGIDNVELIRGTETSPELPANSVDLVIMVDVYHELSHPREMMENIVRALKPGGRFVLLEYRMEDPSVPIKRLHKMSEEQAVREMEAVGLRLKENVGNLPWQHFMVFVRG
ncbi:class I SAM-dependent methyltransferase [Lewinella sp. 4G2]|uniref:class I SAM-dependent methyltransferase n=1 Tax=Lewinella sp. 4G2 TaxID=1803372 RepID=UPI0007B4AF21|nr:class I SAM-dependent methyltransferase [Lewinella sp. 4G2]OAV44056.1 methyltransferase type 11 [Lewinella sp. 4G2]